MAASKKRVQSQHSSFEDSLTVHPLRSLLKSIQDEVDQEYTHKLIYLSRKQLQDRYPALVKVDDLLDLFNALEERYGTDHAADFMETLLEYEQLHGDFGAWKLADGMRQYKVEKAEYISKCQKLGFYQDPYFVGREKHLTDIIQGIQGPATTGVMICGCLGVGKSSLAREVCYKLSNNSEAWQITFVDLREKKAFTELLQSVLFQVSNQRFLKEQNQELMKSELLHCLKKKAQSEYFKSIIWMDNIDGLCDTTDKISIFRDFIKEVCHSMCLEGGGQMKLLLTVDKTECSESLSMDQHLIPDLKLVELEYLSPSESELLLKKFTRSLQTVSDNTLKAFSHGLTGGNPLVVRMLGNLLRGGRSINDIERCIQDHNEQLSMDSLLNKIMNVAFRALVRSLQVLLVKLSIFKLTPFSLADAILITSKDVKTFEKHIFVRRSGELTELSHGLLVELSWLKLSNFIEPKDGQISKNGIALQDHQTFKYHFHPSIEKQLQIYQNLDEFKDAFNEAKYYFCRYFCSVINKYIRKLDTDMQEASTIWEEHNNHFNTWFRYIVSDCLPVDKFYDLQAGHQSLLCQYRIWRVAQTVLDFSEQVNFLQQQIKFANQSSKWYPAVVWGSFIAEYYAGQNQIEEAYHMIMNLSTEYNVLKFINELEVADKLSNILAIFKRIDDKYLADERKQILVSCAFYCGACCKILMKMENYSKTTKHYIILAEKLFSGKYGKSDIRNHIKQSYKYKLANVREMKKIYNDMLAKPNECSTYNFHLNQHLHQHGYDSHAGVIVYSNNSDSHAGVSVDSNNSHTGVSLDSKDSHDGVSVDSKDMYFGVSLDSNDSNASVSMDSNDSHTGVHVDSNKSINVETDRISKCTTFDNQTVKSTHNIESQSHAGVSVDLDKSIDVETDRISKYRPCDTQTGNIKDILSDCSCMNNANNTELNATLSITGVKESVVPTANETAKTDLQLRNANNTELNATLSTTSIKESDIPTSNEAAKTDFQLIGRYSNDLTDFPAVNGNQPKAESGTKYSDILITSESNLIDESIKTCSSSDEAISIRYRCQELIKSRGQRRLSGLSNTLSASEFSDISDRDSYLSTDSHNSVGTDKTRNDSLSGSINLQDCLSRKRPSVDSQYSSLSSEVGRRVSLNRLESQDSVTQLVDSLNTASTCQNSADTDKTINDSFSSSIDLQDRLSWKRPSVDSQYSSLSSDVGRRVSLNRLESQDSVTQFMNSLNTASTFQNSAYSDKTRNESFSSSIDLQDRLSRKRPSVDSQYSSFSSDVGRKTSLNRLESQDSVTQLMDSLNTGSLEEDGLYIGSNDELQQQQSEMSVSDDGPILFKIPKQHE